MKLKQYLYLLCIFFLLTGCFNQERRGEGELDEIDADTALAASAPVTVDPDTTLQPKVELTLKAVGNTLEEMRYDRDTLVAKPGSRVYLTFINEGIDQSMIHNVVFTKPDKYKLVALAGAKVGAPGNYVPDSKIVIAASPLALPGQTVNLEFNAPIEIGTYHFVCTYPGHWKNMNGVFIVDDKPEI